MVAEQPPTFADLLRRARREAELTQEQLAERAGVSARGISDLERGVIRTPRRDTLELLLDALDVPAERRTVWYASRDEAISQPVPSEPTYSLSSKRPLVGRESERGLLREQMDRARGGRGGLVLVSGEAGIGKTVLVQDLAHYARDRNALVLSGGCYDLTATPPYGPWIEGIRDYEPAEGLPETPGLFGNLNELEQPQYQAAIFEEARRFFAEIANFQPLIILLEDMHWADTASLDALRYLARTVGDYPILLVVTYREDEITRNHPLFQLLPMLARESPATRIHLARLDDYAIQRLIADRYELAEEDLQRLTEHVTRLGDGNPLYTVELLRTLEDTRVLRRSDNGATVGDLESPAVPPLIQQVIERRLDRFATETREALRVAAVAGQEIALDLWETVSGLAGDELDHAVREALAAHLLEEAPGRGAFRFSHALVREALYNGLVLTQRRAYHRMIAEVLAGSGRADPDTVSYHFQQAGDERAIEWLLRAGVRAQRSVAWLIAARRFEQAAELLEDDPSRISERGWLLAYAALTARYTNDARLIDTYLARAENLAMRDRNKTLEAAIRWQRGWMLCNRGSIREGLSNMERALAVIKEKGQEAPIPIVEMQGSVILQSLIDPATSRTQMDEQVNQNDSLALRYGTLTNWLSVAGRFSDALSTGQACLAAFADASEDTRFWLTTVGSCHRGLGRATACLGRDQQSRAHFEQARICMVDVGDYFAAGITLTEELVCTCLPYSADQVDERRRLIEQSMQLVSRSSEQSGWQNAGNLGVLMVDILEGRWSDARDAIGDVQPLPTLAVEVAALTGMLDRYQGRPADAWSQVRSALPSGAATEPGDHVLHHGLLVQRLSIDLALDERDVATARAWLDANDRWLEWSGAVLGRAEAQLLWARYYQSAGDLETALVHAEQALDHASDPRQPLALIAAHRVLGQLKTATDVDDAAGKHLRASLELAVRCEAPYEQALTKLEMARLAVHAGDDAEALQLLREVRDTCEELGAQRSLERVSELEQRLSPSTAERPAGLSAREVEVWEYAARGMTNAEIGDALYISPRTVAQHLRSVYNKLGVNSRAAAVRRWRETSRN